MPNYECDYNFKIEEYGTFVTEASDVEEAEQNTLEYLRATYPENLGLEIEQVREVQVAA